MPVISQGRVLPDRVISGLMTRIAPGSTTRYVTDHILSSGVQTTVSFRSTRGKDERAEQDELSGPELRKILRKQYQARYDTGHDFFTEKYTCRYQFEKGATLVRSYRGIGLPGYEDRYTGFFYPRADEGLQEYPTPVVPSQEEIIRDGAKAFGTLAPTRPEAGLATFLGELREQFPQLLGSTLAKKGFSPSSIGHEHLNLEFGIKPFIGDLEKLAQAVLKAGYLTAQFRLDSDKVVRRRALLAETRTSTPVTTFSADYPSMGNFGPTLYYPEQFMDVSGATKTVYDVHSRKVSFSGAFQYHLSESHDFLSGIERYVQLANHLLGTSITPSTVWELTPWSWLIDWFADAGNFIRNIDLLSSDSLVMRYGYIMHENHDVRYRTIAGIRPVEGSVPAACMRFNEYTRKTRTKATPYGFGVDFGTLSPRRLAILTSLGLTHGSGARL